jgi:hypothetical protein
MIDRIIAPVVADAIVAYMTVSPDYPTWMKEVTN